MRLDRSLAGKWQFQLDAGGDLSIEALAPDRLIQVPMPWQAAFADLEAYSGYAWYRQTFQLDDSWLDGEILLNFGAVDYWCQVFINGQLVGEHEGGYTPFTFEIRRYARVGDNQIDVRVYDTIQENVTLARWPDAARPMTGRFDARDIPHGKQDWYLNCGGIWQDVTLSAVPSVYLKDVQVRPDLHTGQVVFRVGIGGDLSTISSEKVQVAVQGYDAETGLNAGQADCQVSIIIDNPQPWNTETPHLYTATVTLGTDGTADSVMVRFGFREITTQDGKLLLNGEPLYLLCALDQDLYPETIYTVPSEDFLRDQFKKAKELGLNSLRCHIKPPDPRYLDLADEMGLLLWTEIPSWRTFVPRTPVHPNTYQLDDAIKQRVQATLRAMIRRDYNHPSLIIWTIVNEDWGTSLPISANDRAWLAEMYDLCKQLDPTRLVVDNSACSANWGPNLHVKSDLDDFHYYANIPDQESIMTQLLEQFSQRPLWSYSNHGDAQRTGKEPLVLSEIGNWGLPSVKGLSGPNGEEPSWFRLGSWWNNSEDGGWPFGVVDRFKQWGLGAIWRDYEALAVASQWHQFQALKFEIETMRRLPNLTGYVLTELTDIYWESNGLLDFNRCPKVYHNEFQSINSPDMIIPEIQHYAVWDDESIGASLTVSHYSAESWTGARLRWEIGGRKGEQEVGELARGEVRDLGVHHWQAPQVANASSVRLMLSLQKGADRKLASNPVDVLVLPASSRKATYAGQLKIDVRHYQEKFATAEADTPAKASRFENVIQQLGYHTTQALSNICVSIYPDAKLLQWVRDGGQLLYLSKGPGPFFWWQARGGAYAGSWMTSFTWIRPEIHRRFPDVSPLSMPFKNIMPHGVILGLPVENVAVHPDLLAGQFTGWVRQPAVHTVQFRYGRGKVVMTTFPLQTAISSDTPDPVAIAMFHDLVEHLASDACQPTLSANY